MAFDETSIPESYVPLLDMRETEKAIKGIKDFFETNLADALDLKRVTAPLFVHAGTGINDDLNGVEEPVRFSVKGLGGESVEIVQSLAKWKRLTLARLGFHPGEGLYTDMNAIRPDEDLDSLHSIYVDQWDWETGHRGRAAQRRVPEDDRAEDLRRHAPDRGASPATTTRSSASGCPRRSPSFTPRSWRRGIRSSRRPSARTASPRSTAPCSSSASARRCLAAASPTTAGRPTTTTGPRPTAAAAASTATSSCGTRCWAARSSCPRWASASTPRR